MILSSEVLKVTCRLSAAGPSFVRVTHGERNRDIMQMNTHSLKLPLSTIKRKIRDCLHFSTVAAYSFWSENVNVSNLILGHPLFSPFMHQPIPAAPSACVYCEIHFTRVFIVHFRLSKILLDLQDDSDVAESLIRVVK